MRSVLHTFSANAEAARADGQRRLDAQSKTHAHALQLLTSEMVAAKQAAQEAAEREGQATASLTETMDTLRQDLSQVRHQLRLAEARANDVERAEMVDRRLVRKVLLRYVSGGKEDASVVSVSSSSSSSSSTEDPVDLLAVILGLDPEQRGVLLARNRRGSSGGGGASGGGGDNEASGIGAMKGFLSTLTGL